MTIDIDTIINNAKLAEGEIEAWLLNRLGEGNVFEQFNRRFCKDLAQAQLDKFLSTLIPCEECNGRGFVQFTPSLDKDCPACKGTGGLTIKDILVAYKEGG